MKILVLVLFTAVVACAPAPATLTYKSCMQMIESGALTGSSDREFCETLNK